MERSIHSKLCVLLKSIIELQIIRNGYFRIKNIQNIQEWLDNITDILLKYSDGSYYSYADILCDTVQLSKVEALYILDTANIIQGCISSFIGDKEIRVDEFGYTVIV